MDFQRARTLMQNPEQSEQLRAVAGAHAEMERQQRAALVRILEATDAADVADSLTPLPEHDQRVTEICSAIGARFRGSPWAEHVEHYAPEDLDGDAAEEYAGMSTEDWEAQCERWVDYYRDSDTDTRGMSDEELVTAHVRTVFGVEPPEFIRSVVDWSEARYFERAMMGPSNGTLAAMQTLADRLEGTDE